MRCFQRIQIPLFGAVCSLIGLQRRSLSLQRCYARIHWPKIPRRQTEAAESMSMSYTRVCQSIRMRKHQNAEPARSWESRCHDSASRREPCLLLGWPPTGPQTVLDTGAPSETSQADVWRSAKTMPAMQRDISSRPRQLPSSSPRRCSLYTSQHNHARHD